MSENCNGVIDNEHQAIPTSSHIPNPRQSRMQIDILSRSSEQTKPCLCLQAVRNGNAYKGSDTGPGLYLSGPEEVVVYVSLSFHSYHQLSRFVLSEQTLSGCPDSSTQQTNIGYGCCWLLIIVIRLPPVLISFRPFLRDCTILWTFVCRRRHHHTISRAAPEHMLMKLFKTIT